MGERNDPGRSPPSGSPWLLGILYASPEDQRLWVPRPSKTGWTINLAHPKTHAALTCIMLGGLAVTLATVLVLRWRLIASAPAVFLWLGLSLTGALIVFHLNFARVRLDGTAISYLGYGAVAFGIGIALQTLGNGTVWALVPAARSSWKAHLYFGAMAALCQTAGKLAVVWLVLRVVPQSDRRTGLSIGLGFTIAEILLIAIGMVLRAEPVVGQVGAWERASAALFHIYSTAIMVIALRRQAYGLIVCVWLVHAVTDWLAGSYGSGTSFGLSLYGLESIFTAAGALMWATFLTFRRGGEADEPAQVSRP